MNFQINNLDNAYTQVSRFNSLVTTNGVELIRNLANNIKNLKNHWKGSDATLHINNLITVYDALCDIVTDVSKVAHNVSMPIVQAQTIRNANGGLGSVDTVISVYDGGFENLESVLETNEYYVDPLNAPADYQTLSYICNDFNRFYSDFGTIKNELLENWTSGSDRAQAVSDIETFESNASSYYKKLLDAQEYLGIATSNLSELG